MKLKNLAAVIAFVFLVAACVSGPVTIPENLTVAELLQRGQEAAERNRYTAAIQYYSTVIERYPFDIDSICAAEYEIAFIYYKQKNYDRAKTGFYNLLERYNVPDEEFLPPHFKILSNIVLAKIEEAESKRGGR